MNNNAIKIIYCYFVCAVSLFVILWGVVDTSTAVISLATQPKMKMSSAIEKSQDYALDEMFQRKFAYDKLFDGAVRIIIPGLVYLYFSKKIMKSEQKKEQ